MVVVLVRVCGFLVTELVVTVVVNLVACDVADVAIVVVVGVVVVDDVHVPHVAGHRAAILSSRHILLKRSHSSGSSIVLHLGTHLGYVVVVPETVVVVVVIEVGLILHFTMLCFLASWNWPRGHLSHEFNMIFSLQYSSNPQKVDIIEIRLQLQQLSSSPSRRSRPPVSVVTVVVLAVVLSPSLPSVPGVVVYGLWFTLSDALLPSPNSPVKKSGASNGCCRQPVTINGMSHVSTGISSTAVLGVDVVVVLVVDINKLALVILAVS